MIRELPSIKEDCSEWPNDTLVEGPLSWHMRDEINKLHYVMGEADRGLHNLSRSMADVRSKLREVCPNYPPDIHSQTANACRAVELARSQLATAHADIYALLSRFESMHG